MSKKPCAKATAAKKRTHENTPAQSRGSDTRVQPRDCFQVVIQCATEDEQERLYHEFRSRNFIVRLLTM
ncbi:MAG: hypothetical protein K8R36_19210 [Planctomycetales bacterium]|nr:hypothetical protein [Planctomycetales bacterium]